MEASEKILIEAQGLLDPHKFNQFTSSFWELHKEPRVSYWNSEVLALLEWMRISENLSKNYCRYLLSLGVRLSDQLYFVTNACELLPFSDYLKVLTSTSRFLQEPFDEVPKLRIWFDILEIVWQSELLRRWFLRVSQTVFPTASEKLEFLVDLRHVLSGEKFLNFISFGNTFRYVNRSLDEAFQVEYLQTVVEEYLPNNYYLRNRFLVLTAGGEMFIYPQRGRTLPSNPVDSVNPRGPKTGCYTANQFK